MLVQDTDKMLFSEWLVYIFFVQQKAGEKIFLTELQHESNLLSHHP